MKMLHVDPMTGERTALMRIEPGSSCPAHDPSRPRNASSSKAASISTGRTTRRAITSSREPAAATGSPPLFPAGCCCSIGTPWLPTVRPLPPDLRPLARPFIDYCFADAAACCGDWCAPCTVLPSQLCERHHVKTIRRAASISRSGAKRGEAAREALQNHGEYQ